MRPNRIGLKTGKAPWWRYRHPALFSVWEVVLFLLKNEQYGLRFSRTGQFRQSGNLAGGGTFMQNALFSGFIDGRLGDSELGLCPFGIVSCCLANFFNNGLNTGLDRPVAHTADLILAGAFEC